MFESGVKAIILAAGKGTRMKSELPKVLHQLYGKPILAYVLDMLSLSGLNDENYLVVGHGAEKVEEYVNKNYSNLKCVLQSEQKGTGDAVNRVYPLLKGYSGTVLVVCGDTPLITAETIKAFIEHHKTTNSALTVMSAIFDNPTNYGRIVRDGNNNVKAIVEEKDATSDQKQIKEINAGVYCIDWAKVSDAFLSLTNNNAQGEYYLTDIVDWAVKQNLKVQAYPIKENSEVFGINSRQNLAEAMKILTQRTLKNFMSNGVTIISPETTFISPETTIGTDTVILPNVYIQGKNTIGSHCQIGPFSHIRGGANIGNYVKIGNFVEVKNTTIKDHTNACHLTYLGDSELGENVNIGAGTITANYNHLTKEKKKTKIDDGVSIGSNSVLVAPVEIGENATVAALSVITKNVEPNALALTRSPMKVFKDWFNKKLQEYKGGSK